MTDTEAMPESNVEVVRVLIDAWNARDEELAAGYLTPDIEWAPAGPAAVERVVYRGPEECARGFACRLGDLGGVPLRGARDPGARRLGPLAWACPHEGGHQPCRARSGIREPVPVARPQNRALHRLPRLGRGAGGGRHRRVERATALAGPWRGRKHRRLAERAMNGEVAQSPLRRPARGGARRAGQRLLRRRPDAGRRHLRTGVAAAGPGLVGGGDLADRDDHRDLRAQRLGLEAGLGAARSRGSPCWRSGST